MDCIEAGDRFAEPVPDFDHSRTAPLLCFVVSERRRITHVARATRGIRAGTGMRRLNLTQPTPVVPPVSLRAILPRVPPRLRFWASATFKGGGLLPPKTSAAVVDALACLSPSCASAISRFGAQRERRISRLSQRTLHGLATQKLAVNTALSIAGLPRADLQDWDPGPQAQPSSFLDGLPSVRLREDPMVLNDLLKCPGHNLIRSLPYSATVFQGDVARLTVVLANRLPLEEQTGTDLIYFNETFRSFVMVQYKAMEREGEQSVFRLPNDQLAAEISRMHALREALQRCRPSAGKDSFRLTDNPFFLKLCPRIVFNPDDVGLVPGMYIPLDYWTVLCDDASLGGPRGGRAVSYANVGRYLNNTEFVAAVSKAWVGTTINQSAVLEAVIRSTIENGKAVALGIGSSVTEPLP